MAEADVDRLAEAIFLSAFVMIGQNRQAEFQRSKADHDFATGERELRLNTELTREVHALTTELRRQLLDIAGTAARPGAPQRGTEL